jgi:DNA polymerase III subunit gamma/tau
MYQVIARKYRPQTFGELIGQEHVQKTLANAIESSRIAHGYIFSGQRGTGKTTVARILARCLNCIHGPTISPCGVCSSCTEISAGNSIDVIEIDAASNRGINEMREIRENVRYRPARDRYKVFIVDEAHQITKEAFNALLKTLEEPPDWVVFILCTTEANEIPNTIASRCQHFTFRSVDFAELMARMRYIAEREGISASDEVLSVIAQAGEGSVRDSLSALDQAIACCGRTLQVEDIRSLLGVFGVDSLRAVAEALEAQSGSRMLEIVQELESSGQSLQHFCRELSRYWRNLLVAKIAGKPTRLISASEAEQRAFLETASKFSEEDLTRYLNLTLELYKTMQYSLQPRLHLELGLIKLVQAGRLQAIEQAIAALDTPAQDGAPLTATARASVPRPANFQAPSAPSKLDPPAAKSQVRAAEPSKVEPASTEPPAAVSSGDLKTDLQNALRSAGMAFSADAVAQSDVELEDGDLILRAPKMMAMSLQDAAVQRIAGQVVGKPVKIKFEIADDRKPAAPAPLQPEPNSVNGNDEVRERALSHPGVKHFQEIFPGSQIRAVRNLNE